MIFFDLRDPAISVWSNLQYITVIAKTERKVNEVSVWIVRW